VLNHAVRGKWEKWSPEILVSGALDTRYPASNGYNESLPNLIKTNT
jgi:hypothetical protein